MTVRMYLPFSMGKVTHTDPYTFEPIIEHPILDIGSSYSSIKPHIIKWLAEQHYNVLDIVGIADGNYYIDFRTEEDMIWFKLRWL